jgi:hypothetical protein
VTRDAKTQIDTFFNHIADNKEVLYPDGENLRIWLDIEWEPINRVQGTNRWTEGRTKAQNVEYLRAMIAATEENIAKEGNDRISFGIYTSLPAWQAIMGLDITEFGVHELWYPQYNNDASFHGQRPFGGWDAAATGSTVAMKQFEGDYKFCGHNIDFNWRPVVGVGMSEVVTESPVEAAIGAPVPEGDAPVSAEEAAVLAQRETEHGADSIA